MGVPSRQSRRWELRWLWLPLPCRGGPGRASPCLTPWWAEGPGIAQKPPAQRETVPGLRSEWCSRARRVKQKREKRKSGGGAAPVRSWGTEGPGVPAGLLCRLFSAALPAAVCSPSCTSALGCVNHEERAVSFLTATDFMVPSSHHRYFHFPVRWLWWKQLAMLCSRGNEMLEQGKLWHQQKKGHRKLDTTTAIQF